MKPAPIHRPWRRFWLMMLLLLAIAIGEAYLIQGFMPFAGGKSGVFYRDAAGRSSFWMTRVLPLTIVLTATLLLVWFVQQQFKYMAKSAAAAREEVQNILPDALKQPPPATTMPSGLRKWLIASFTAAIPIVVGAGWLVGRFWPHAPGWVARALPISIVTLFIIGVRYIWPPPGLNREAARKQLRGVAWFVVWIMGLVSFPDGYGLDLIFSRLPRNPPLLVVVTFALGLPALMAWLMTPPILIGWAARRALRRGDYALALRRIEWLSIDRTLYDGTRSSALISAGRPQEAKEIVSKGLQTERGKKAVGLHLNNLGLAFMDQGRYEEAEGMFKRSLQAYPDRGGAYDGLAESLILRGDPGPALEAAEQALAKELSRGWLYRRLSRSTRGRMWANRARALAALGRRPDAEQAILNAFAEVGTKDKPELAGVHYRAGMMRASLGDMLQVREEWSAAKQLDPDGRYGRKADEALTGASVRR